MRNTRLFADYPERLMTLQKIKNFAELVEFLLPYGFAKIYMTANRRWSFLRKERRKEALALLLNKHLKLYSFNVWDIRGSDGYFMEDVHTIPIISILEIITVEFARQEKLICEKSPFSMAIYKLASENYITSGMKHRLDKLSTFKALRDKKRQPHMEKISDQPHLYQEAVDALFEIEELFLTYTH
jgi:hypothetical protein